MAGHWSTLFPADLFDEERLEYCVRACCASREWRGPITADEFYRTFLNVRASLVWSVKRREWIPLQDAVETITEQHKLDALQTDTPYSPGDVDDLIAEVYGLERLPHDRTGNNPE